MYVIPSFSDNLSCIRTPVPTQTRSQSLLICYLKAMKDRGEMTSLAEDCEVCWEGGKKFGLPLMQCALVKSFSGATGNESGTYFFLVYHALSCVS